MGKLKDLYDDLIYLFWYILEIIFYKSYIGLRMQFEINFAIVERFISVKCSCALYSPLFDMQMQSRQKILLTTFHEKVVLINYL